MKVEEKEKDHSEDIMKCFKQVMNIMSRILSYPSDRKQTDNKKRVVSFRSSLQSTMKLGQKHI